MGTLKHSLNDDVFAVFERACQQNEFELADHMLLALEVMARKQNDTKQLDSAYLTFIACCDLGTRPTGPKQGGRDEGRLPLTKV